MVSQFMLENKIILIGEISKFAEKTYPNCRDYNKYRWCSKKRDWVLNKPVPKLFSDYSYKNYE
jgi:hypothetical protein